MDGLEDRRLCAKIETISRRVFLGVATALAGTTALADPARAIEMRPTDAVKKGAKLIVGGTRQGHKGYFFAPTILAHVPTNAREE